MAVASAPLVAVSWRLARLVPVILLTVDVTALPSLPGGLSKLKANDPGITTLVALFTPMARLRAPEVAAASSVVASAV